MITTERLKWFADTLGKAMENIPKLAEEVRETAEDRERLMAELEESGRAQDALNVTVADLKERVAGLDARVHELLTQNARLERLILTAGEALRGSPGFVEAAQALAKPSVPKQLDAGF